MAQTVLKNLEAMALGDLVGDVGREGYWLRCWLALSIAAAVSMRRETAAGKWRRETSRREKTTGKWLCLCQAGPGHQI
jgi:hypothetical protein